VERQNADFEAVRSAERSTFSDLAKTMKKCPKNRAFQWNVPPQKHLILEVRLLRRSVPPLFLGVEGGTISAPEGASDG
jgi:hypothetical protein